MNNVFFAVFRKYHEIIKNNMELSIGEIFLMMNTTKPSTKDSSEEFLLLKKSFLQLFVHVLRTIADTEKVSIAGILFYSLH